MFNPHASTTIRPTAGRDVSFPILHGQMSIKMVMGHYGPIHSDLRKYVRTENKPSTHFMPLDISAECQTKPFAFAVRDAEMIATHYEQVKTGRIRAIKMTDLPDLLCSSQYETVNMENGRPVLLGKGGNGTAFLGRCKETNQLVTLKFAHKANPLNTNSGVYSALIECGVHKRAYEAVQRAESKGEIVAKVPQIYGILKLKDRSEYLRKYFSYIIVSEFIGLVPNNPVALTWDKAVALNKKNPAVFDDASFINMLCALIRTTEILVENNMMHADIKGNNILIGIHGGKPVPYLIDFGNAFEQIEENVIIYNLDKHDWLDPYLYQGSAPTKTGDLYSMWVLMDKSSARMERLYHLRELARWQKKIPVSKRLTHKQARVVLQNTKVTSS